MENLNQGKNRNALLGVVSIVKKLGRSYLDLKELKRSYAFPLKTFSGQPCVNLGEFDEWVKEWGNGLPWEKITNHTLQSRIDLERLKAMPSKPLCDINSIVEFCGCPANEVLNWQKFGIGCPIKKDKTGFHVDGKDLKVWMYKTGIRQNKEERSLDSF